MDLCALDETQHERGLSAFLRAAMAPDSDSDPRTWSVGERLFALAHYCCHVMPDGPDYSVTATSKLSDYLQLERDDATPTAFSAAGDDWLMQPLLGAAAEAIEAAQTHTEQRSHAHWLIGAMAAQLHRVGESAPDPVRDAAHYAAWLQSRMDAFLALPASDFEAIFHHYARSMEQGSQLFQIWFDAQGIIVLPKTGIAKGGAAVSDIPPARFCIHACLSDITHALFGKLA